MSTKMTLHWIVCFAAARPSDTEMPGLCSDAELRRNEWPWIGEFDSSLRIRTVVAVCTPSISRPSVASTAVGD